MEPSVDTPIVIVPHDPAWSVAFEREADAIRQALAGTPITLHHIGSTALAGILAKPVIDLLGVIENLSRIDCQTDPMRALGYDVMGPFGIEGRRYFRKFDGGGNRTHHLHVFGAGSPHIERHLAFRDYLRAKPATAEDHSNLKATILSRPGVTPDEYMDAKAPFIAGVEALALD